MSSDTPTRDKRDAYTANGDHINVTADILTSKTRNVQKAEDTQQQTTDEHGADDIRKPPYNPQKQASLLEVNSTHYKSVLLKARHTCGYGVDLVPAEGIEDPSEDERETLEEFWYNGTYQLGPYGAEYATATDVLEAAWTDYESIGWLTTEVLVQGDGTPIGLAHVPAHEVRVRDEGHGYVQDPGGQGNETYYGVAGDRYGDSPTFVNKETGETGASGDEIANELIWHRKYSPREKYYGIPDHIPVLQEIRGDQAAARYNADLFENDGMPRYVIVVEGGSLSEESRENVRNMMRGLREDNHKGAILEAEKLAESDPLGEDSNVNIRLEPVGAQLDQDAAFMEYRQNVEHEIAKVHDVPPQLVNRLENSNRSNSKELLRDFTQTVIQPKQESFAEKLTQIIHREALGITDWNVEFRQRGADSDLRDAEITELRARASQGVHTVNERRREMGLEELDGPLGEMLISEMGGRGGGMGGGVIESLVSREVDQLREELEAELGESIY